MRLLIVIVRTLLHKCDEMLLFKYVIQNGADARNKTVTFMPKLSGR